jgi:hypothetical protein
MTILVQRQAHAIAGGVFGACFRAIVVPRRIIRRHINRGIALPGRSFEATGRLRSSSVLAMPGSDCCNSATKEANPA